MLKLTQQEQAWLDDYRKAIEEKHPGVVHEMLIYGSKARGQPHAESDLDVLLIVKNDGGRDARRVFGGAGVGGGRGQRGYPVRPAPTRGDHPRAFHCPHGLCTANGFTYPGATPCANTDVVAHG